jgi:hypothetical protein
VSGPSRLRVIVGASFDRAGASELHDLARAFRAGDDAAAEAVSAIILAGLAREAPELDAAVGVTLVPMAGHEARTQSGRAERLAAALAAAHLGWTIQALIERIADAPRALDGGPRDPHAESATLRWSAVDGDGAVVLVDDVVHTGASLEAAWLVAPTELRARLVALAAFRARD